MKRIVSSFGLALLMAGVLAVVGCSKKTESEGPPADSLGMMDTMGAPMDTASMDTAMHSEASEPTYAPSKSGSTASRSTSKSGSKTPAVPVADTRREPTLVPAGTPVSVTLSNEITTKTAEEGDKWSGVVASDVIVDGENVFPKGSRVEGHVVLAERAGKSSGKSQLQLAFDRIVVHGDATQIKSVGQRITGSNSTSGDVKRIGGGAAAGAVVGGILGGGSGAVKGAVVGGAAGTAASLLKRAPDVTLEAGSQVEVRLDRPVPVGGSSTEAVSK